MKIIDKVFENNLVSEEDLIEYFCPSEFGYESYEGLECQKRNCKKCWSREVEE